VIAVVGNYGEIYQRTLGPLGLPRGLNALWLNGGLMHPLPVQ
jgi:general L-amino acid transport system substrate-binding protein